jgi:hypothetical protein
MTMPFFMRSCNEELHAKQQPGVFAVRFSDSRPRMLTVEVQSRSVILHEGSIQNRVIRVPE